MRLRGGVYTLLFSVLLAGCVHPGAASRTSVAPTLKGDSAHPDITKGWVDTKLYFGLGLADHPEHGISEADWRSFLDRVVTPRFPSGLSVVDVYGQWQGKDQHTVERLRTKMLIILYADNEENWRRLRRSERHGSRRQGISRYCG